MKLSLRWLYPAAIVCLFLSGVAGLVYQVVWARYLALFLGHTSYAVVAVLVAFMGGLALGNAWIGRWADRVERPLSLYAWLELGVALYAVAFPAYFELCQDGYLSLARRMAPGSGGLLGLKFGFGFAAILLPTTLMGGTLPVLTRLVTRSLGELRSRVAGLYFVNSVGAVVGVMIAEYWWIPEHGLDPTVLWAGFLNAVVAILALLMSAGLRMGGREELAEAGVGGGEEGVGVGEEPEERYSAGELRLAVVAAGVSGFVAMLYEVVWTRVLALVLGSSTHAFSIMLMTFIGGLATGAWWVGRWRRRGRTFDAFGWAEMALAGVLVVTMFTYHLLPYAFVRLGAMITRMPGHFAVYQGAQLLVCVAVMFLPAFCLGLTLPLVSRVATSELARTGRSVGLVFSVNTLGTVLGAAVTGLWLLPWLGLAGTFVLGIALNVLIAVAVLVRRSAWMFRGILGLGPVLVVGLVMAGTAGLGSKWSKSFSMGLWRVHQPPRDLRDYLGMVNEFDLRYHRDGAGSTVAVNTWRNPANGRVELGLRVNGKADATTQGDLPTQMLLGHLPLLLRPEAAEVMVVGVGSGITVSSALTHPTVKRVDAVEISPEVCEAARREFGSHNRGALEDPRVSVIIDDAKSFLKTAGRTYDVIVSEPSNPWMAGVAGVFSLEFYETCRASLRPGGLMVQWVHIYESNNEALEMVLATYTAVFPFLTVWQSLPGDLILVGSDRPLTFDLAAMQERFDVPSVTADLQRADLFRLPVILGLQLVSQFNAPFLVGSDAPKHSDFRPLLEYVAERGFFAREEADLHVTFDESGSRRPGTLLAEYLVGRPLTVTDAQSFALFHTAYRLPRPQVMRSILERWRELAPDSTLPAEYSAKMDFPLPVSELEAQRMARVRGAMMTNAATELEPLRMYSRHLMHGYRYLRSVYYQPPTEEIKAVLGRLVEVDEVHRATHELRLAEIAWDEGDEGRLLELAARAFVPKEGVGKEGPFSLDYRAPGHVLALAIETQWRARRAAEAKAWCEAAVAAGYLRRESQYYSPVLAMTVRKVMASVGEERRDR